MVSLHRDKFGKACLPGEGIGLGQLPGITVGDTDLPHFSGTDLFIQGFQNVIDRVA